MRFLLIPIALAVLVWFATTTRALLAQSASRRRTRATYFADVPLTDLQSRIEPSGFPRVAGRYQGHAVDLQAVPDSLSFRKLPALWVMATLTEPQPVAGEVHLIARAGGQEPFSRAHLMPVQVPLPKTFPEDVTLRCESPSALPDTALLEQLAPLFRNPALKEIVLSPIALRLVILAEEADRTSYLIYRDAELGRSPLPPGKAAALFDQLLTLSKALHDA